MYIIVATSLQYMHVHVYKHVHACTSCVYRHVHVHACTSCVYRHVHVYRRVLNPLLICKCTIAHLQLVNETSTVFSFSTSPEVLEKITMTLQNCLSRMWCPSSPSVLPKREWDLSLIRLGLGLSLI